jgi:hypothetical protein
MVTTKESFAAAIEGFLGCSEPELESEILNMYTKDSVVTVNGNRMTWDDFYPYFRGINNSMESIKIVSHRILQNGNLFAERHTAHGIDKEGTNTEAEAICMFEVNEDEKIIWFEETLYFAAGKDTTTVKYE